MPDAPLKKHGIEVAPPASVASPDRVDAKPGEDVPWWTPSLGEVLAHLGWRWLWFLPAIVLIVGSIVILPIRPGYWQVLLSFGKPLFMVIALPTGMAIYAMKTVVRHRKDAFCIHCGYSVEGLPDHHRCPECGRKFCRQVIEEYRRDPHWFVQRWKRMQTTRAPEDGIAFMAGTGTRKKSRDGT